MFLFCHVALLLLPCMSCLLMTAASHLCHAGEVTPQLACQLLAATLPLLQPQQQLEQEGRNQQQLQARPAAAAQPSQLQAEREERSSNWKSSGSSTAHGPAESSSSSDSNKHEVANSSTSSDSCSSLSGSAVAKRAVSEAATWQLPNQTNRLALLFGPHAAPGLAISFGLEIFEPGHITPRHIHSSAHELFFVLAGEGLGVVGGREGQRMLQQQQQQGQQQQSKGHEFHVRLKPGDVAVFPPGVVHALDNPYAERLYCLQVRVGGHGGVVLNNNS